MSNLTKLLMLLAIGLVLAAGSIYLIGGKRQDYKSSATIKAPVGQIFPYVVDPQLKQQWMKGLNDQEITQGDSVAEGSLLKSTRTSNGISESFDDEVIRFSENEIISVKSKNKRLTSTTMLKFKELGDGTKVTFTRVIKFHGIDRFKTVFAQSDFQSELERDLGELVKLVESNMSGATGSTVSSSSDSDDNESNQGD